MTIKPQPLVSVVTPVYNTEKYLAECIESVLVQTYENWEYIIVNNCSTDRSLEIAQQYAEKDARIIIHNNIRFLEQLENGNHAMRQISSESKYCKVLHADDWLFPECITRMVEVAESNPSVGSVGSYRLEENRVTLDGLPYPCTMVTGKDTCRLLLLKGVYLFGSPTSLLIRSDIVRARENFYDVSNIHSDVEVCFDILQKSNFGFVHQILTFTRRHNESATSRGNLLNTKLIGSLIIIIKYGPVYLSKEEYGGVSKRYLKVYYRTLGLSIFKKRSKEFWAYHREELKKLGIPLSLSRLIKSAVIVSYNRILRRLMV